MVRQDEHVDESRSQLNAIHGDAEVAALKGEILDRVKWGAFLNNFSDVIRFLIAPLITVGVGLMAVPASRMLSEGGLSNFSMGTLLGDTGAASGMMLFGVGAVCTLLAIGTSYTASRIYQSYNFDLTEIGAQHTAKYIARELENQQQAPQEQQASLSGESKDTRWQQVVALKPPAQDTRHIIN